MHNDAYVDVSKCLLSCFDLVLAHSTPAYYTFDTSRSITLVYNSRTAHPRPVVLVDAHPHPADPVPDVYSIALMVNGGLVDPLDGTGPVYYTYGDATRAPARLAVQFDGGAYATGVYTITAIVTAWIAGSPTASNTISGHLIIVNESASPFGAGWDVAGLQRVHVNPAVAWDAVITEGDGSAARFARSCSSCAFVTPAGEFSTLQYNPALGYTRVYPDGTVISFDLVGQMGQVYFRNRLMGTAIWSAGIPTALFDPTWRAFAFAYDGAGRLAAITDPGNRQTTFLHSAGNLQRITFRPDSTYEEFSYMTAGYQRLMSQSRDKRGSVTDYHYQYGRQPSAIDQPAVAIADSAGAVRSRTVLVSTTWNSIAWIAGGFGTAANPAPHVPSSHTEPWMLDPRGQRTNFFVDRFGAATLIAEPLNRLTWIHRNANSLPTQIVEPRGTTTNFHWSGFRLDSLHNASTGRKIRYQYTSTYSNLQSVQGDAVTVQNYWGSGDAVLDSSRVGPVASRYWYDGFGRVIQARDPEGNNVFYEYNVGNTFQNLDTIRAGPRRSGYGYDALLGRVAAMRDPVGGVTAFTYDPRNRITQSTNPNNAATRYVFDELFLVSVEDARNQVYTKTPNALGWIVAETHPGTGTETYQYDLNGNLARWTNRRGDHTTFSYDALDQLTTRNGAGIVATYTAHPAGLYVAAQNGESTDTIYSDIAGRDSLLVSVRSGVSYRMQNTFNVRDLRTMRQFLNPATAGAVLYAYNAWDGIASVSNPTGFTTFGYDANLQVSSLTYPTSPAVSIGQTHSSAYGRASVTPSGSPATLLSLYVQDLNGRVSERWTSSRMRDFTYYMDAQLADYTNYDASSISCSQQQDYGNTCSGSLAFQNAVSFSWDVVGNPSSGGGTVLSNNRLLQFGGFTMTYDSAGNMTGRSSTGDTRTLYLNALGQLDSLRLNGALHTYGYDAWGRRVRKSGPGGTTRHVWDGDNIVLEADGAFNTTAVFGYAGSRPIHIIRGDVRYYVPENPGSIVGLFNTSGMVTHAYRYEPFGTREPPDTAETFLNPLRFAGQYFDHETGLYYMRARYYDPELRRFISEDPTGLSGGINPYVYAGNDPINVRDPSGLQPELRCVQGYFEDLSDSSAIVVSYVCTRWEDGPFGWLDGWLADRAARFGDRVADMWAESRGGGGGTEVLDNMTYGAFPSWVTSGAAVLPYRAAAALTRGHKSAIQAHKLLEARHLRPWGLNIKDAPAVVITRQAHQSITNRMRALLPYGQGPYSKEKVWSALQDAYSSQPAWLAAVRHYFR